MNSFYNTINLSGIELKDANDKARTQEQLILLLF